MIFLQKTTLSFSSKNVPGQHETQIGTGCMLMVVNDRYVMDSLPKLLFLAYITS